MIPKVGGVYIVLRITENPPTFLRTGTGRFYKDKDPNVDINELKSNWIEKEPILYIGKSDDIHKRIEQFMKFGMG